LAPRDASLTPKLVFGLPPLPFLGCELLFPLSSVGFDHPLQASFFFFPPFRIRFFSTKVSLVVLFSLLQCSLPRSFSSGFRFFSGRSLLPRFFVPLGIFPVINELGPPFPRILSVFTWSRFSLLMQQIFTLVLNSSPLKRG